jgi:NAD(P)H-dependent flavin oxidoreductase YrpB (nitropropane dioxygenase family)
VSRFTDLAGCSLPVQQAGMGITAGAPLASAVADAGGLGMLSGAATTAQILADEIAECGDRAVGVNFLVPFLDPALLDIAASRVRIVELFYGDPDAELVRAASAHGARVGWQIGSVDEAVAAAHAGCDYVVAQGVEAGGHVRGSRPLAELLVQVRAAVDVPVVAAGGVGDASAAQASMLAGADAVRAGTRFVAATEANAHPAYVDALIAASADDTTMTTAFDLGWPDAPHRVLRSCVDALASTDGTPIGEMTLAGNRIPVPPRLAAPPTRDASGRIGTMALYAGRSVEHVHKPQSAAEIVRELARS